MHCKPSALKESLQSMFVVSKRSGNGKIKGEASGAPVLSFAIKSLPGIIWDPVLCSVLADGWWNVTQSCFLRQIDTCVYTQTFVHVISWPSSKSCKRVKLALEHQQGLWVGRWMCSEVFSLFFLTMPSSLDCIRWCCGNSKKRVLILCSLTKMCSVNVPEMVLFWLCLDTLELKQDFCQINCVWYTERPCSLSHCYTAWPDCS